MIKKISLVIFILGLVYILSPEPILIDYFRPLPGSVKSIFAGDTIQNPNIAAYFSNYSRSYIKNFYQQEVSRNVWFGFIPPITIVRPPEEAYQFIRDQQESTHLVEYTYPLRESLYVNLVEPAALNKMNGKAPDFYLDHIEYLGKFYLVKTTIRLYPPKLIYRIIEYFGIWISLFALVKISRKALAGVD